MSAELIPGALCRFRDDGRGHYNLNVVMTVKELRAEFGDIKEPCALLEIEHPEGGEHLWWHVLRDLEPYKAH